MTAGQARGTAEYMASFRALETTRSAGRRLFEDRFAVAFLRPRLRLVVALSSVGVAGALIRAYIDNRWSGARTSTVARTRFIDDAAASALGSGLEQVVLLGAGFDARAYRLAAMTRLTVFEVDHPSTPVVKRKVVESLLGSTGFAALAVGLGAAYTRSPRFLFRHPGPAVLTATAALAWWGVL